MALDITRLRQDTPACQNLIHFNNAGASLMPQPVLDAVVSYLKLESQIGGYEAAEQEAALIQHTYDSLATLVGGKPQEIAVLENATRAWDMAFYSIPFQPGDRILTVQAEYSSNYLAYLQMARQKGVTIEVIPNDEYGQLDLNALENAIDNRVKLISVTHIPSHDGLINPAAQIGRLAQQAGVLYLLDACQSVGQLDLNINDLGCDMLASTGRKYLRGPRGTGFLWVRESLLNQLEPPFIDSHASIWLSPNEYQWRPDARRFESWEASSALKIGLGVAARYALNVGLPAIEERVTALAAQLRTQLTDIPGVAVHDLGLKKGGSVTFTLANLDALQVKERLHTQHINVSVSGMPGIQPPHPDLAKRGLTILVRASVHYYNTQEEVEKFCQVVRKLAAN